MELIPPPRPGQGRVFFTSLNVSWLLQQNTQQVSLYAVNQMGEATPQIDAHAWQRSEGQDCLL